MENNKLTKELLNIKKQVEKAVQESQELKGRISQIEATLKQEFQCKDIKEAESLLTQLEDQEEELQQEVRDGLTEVKETYDF